MIEENEEISFSGLILGFSSAALQYIGAAKSEKRQQHLSLARQNIDIIQMLSEKTKGNLDKDESDLISSVIEDLKLKFIETAKD